MVVLLAINPSTRETGWAIFSGDSYPNRPNGDAQWGDESALPSSMQMVQAHPHWQLVDTGVIIVHCRNRQIVVEERIKAIEAELDRILEMWRPQDVACGNPFFVQLSHQQEGLEVICHALKRWGRTRSLPIHSYSVQEIKSAILGWHNVAGEELTYAMMTRWGLLGKEKTTHELKAISVGDYHLVRQKMAPGIEI